MTPKYVALVMLEGALEMRRNATDATERTHAPYVRTLHAMRRALYSVRDEAVAAEARMSDRQARWTS